MLCFVADVAGHGVPAALLTMLIIACFRDRCEPHLPPSKVLALMNGALTHTLPEMFATMIVVSLDIETSRLEYALAGHPAPILWRAETGRARVCDGAGIALGIAEDMRFVLIFPTNDGKTCIAAGGAIDEFHEFRSDIEGNYLEAISKIEGLVEQVRGGEREKFIGTADQPNFFRKPYGAGWALVGDAGYHRDFGTGLGITDAFRDVELLVDAIDAGFSDREPLDEAMAEYERKRNDIAEPLYEVTLQMASGEEIDAAAFMKFGAALARMIPEELPA